jgi:hypothetical protein
MDKLKGTIKSRTMYFGFALVVFGILQDNIQWVSTLVPPNHVGSLVTGIGLIVGILRWVTTDALADK